MTIPLRFPNHLDVIRQDAEAFHRLSPDERLQHILGLLDCGKTLVAQSPHRAAIREQQQRHEEAWQLSHRTLFQQHGI